MTNRWGNNGNNDTFFSWAPKSLQMVMAAMRLKDACSLEESYDKHRQHIKKQKHFWLMMQKDSHWPEVQHECAKAKMV